MNAVLNVYKSCGDDKPYKTYTCKRLLFGASKKAMALADKMQNKSEAEQVDMMLDLFQVIFPEFTEDDMDGLDATEIEAFINEIVSATNKEFDRAQKK